MYTGLDLSLTAAGLANISATGVISHEVFGTEKKKFKNTWDRINFFVNYLEKWLIDTDTKYIVIEDYLVTPHFNTTKQLVELGACVRMMLYLKKIPFVTVVGSQLKKYATGNGNAKKAVIIKELFKDYNIDVNDDNEADAIYLSFICRDLVTRKFPTKKTTKEVLEKIDKEREKINW